MPEIVSTSPANLPDIKGVHTRSRINTLSYHNYITPLFGECTPFDVMRCVPDDKQVRFQSKHNARSYTLKAPLMQEVRLKKDYFTVYNKSILPLNWDIIYKAPKLGDDAPKDANCIVPLNGYIRSLLINLTSVFNTSDFTSASSISNYLRYYFHFLNCVEQTHSDGSIFSYLGCKLSKHFFIVNDADGSDYTIDDWIDFFCDWFISNLGPSKLITSFEYRIDNDTVPTTVHALTDLRLLFERLRCGGIISSIVGTYSDDFHNVVASSPLAIFGTDDFTTFITGEEILYNITPQLAYQIACAHFYTNDSVDYIYSADLYRNYIYHLMMLLNGVDTFSWNGIDLPFDYLSGHNITFNIMNADILNIAPLWYALFGYRRSLRYMDYFVGARTRPYAVGDVDAPVVSNKVNVVDFAKYSARARFANAVNRLKSGVNDYIRGIFNASPKPDYHNPQFLVHLEDDVFTPEVENTGDKQFNENYPNSVSSIFRSSSDRYAFQVDIDEPCVIIGIEYFDIARSYFTTINRHYFHQDRYDMFNPFLQFVGDVPIYQDEIGKGSLPDLSINPFGYTLKDMEYKQNYNICGGGFINHLPGYIFKDDVDFEKFARYTTNLHISPDYIRSKSHELDKFYLSLTGVSRCSYFHFIIDNHNINNASRPMAMAPTIL